MSLINKVLRDLDARHAADSERAGLAHSVKALPPRHVAPWEKFVQPVLGAVIGALLVLFLIEIMKPGKTEPPVEVVTTPAPEVKQEIAEAPPAPEAPPAAPVEPVAVPRAADLPLKLDTDISTAIPESIAPKAARKPAALEKTPAAPGATATVVAGNMPVTAPAGSTTPQINKRMSSGGLNEQAETEYLKGLSAARRGANADAADAYRLALKLQNDHVFARQALLALLVEQKQWQAAEVLALDGASVMPLRHDWALLAARIQFERGDAASALDTMTQHAAGAKQSADYQVFHALLLQRFSRHGEAAACYRTALLIRPEEGRWWYALGRALDADQKEAEARQAYVKAKESGNLPADILLQVERRLH